jgi:hypothetical protein
VRNELAVDATLAHASGYELAVLRSEIEHHHCVDWGRRGAIVPEEMGGFRDGRLHRGDVPAVQFEDRIVHCPFAHPRRVPSLELPPDVAVANALQRATTLFYLDRGLGLFVLVDFTFAAKVDVGPVETPIPDLLDLQLQPGAKRVDPFGQMEIDDGAVVDPELAADRIERDLQTAIEVAPHWGLEEER